MSQAMNRERARTPRRFSKQHQATRTKTRGQTRSVRQRTKKGLTLEDSGSSSRECAEYVGAMATRLWIAGKMERVWERITSFKASVGNVAVMAINQASAGAETRISSLDQLSPVKNVKTRKTMSSL